MVESYTKDSQDLYADQDQTQPRLATLATAATRVKSNATLKNLRVGVRKECDLAIIWDGCS